MDMPVLFHSSGHVYAAIKLYGIPLLGDNFHTTMDIMENYVSVSFMQEESSKVNCLFFIV